MRSRAVRKKRLSTFGKVVCFLALLAAILCFVYLSFYSDTPQKKLVSLQTETEPPYECKTSDTYVITCTRAENDQMEVNRLMNKRVSPKYAIVSALEYDPSELTDTPAVSGGLYTDRQDLEKPRDGEKYVTFAEYLDCLGRNLRVDYRKQREEELTNAEVRKSFPYVVSLATVELGDIKALMCNITVPIRHMMYVINSDVTSVTNFFHDVEKAFNFTQRLRIHWPGYNMGFSGAVNYAMRDAMRYPFDEVPFFFILNNDIRFPEKTLPRAVPQFRKVTRKDKAMLEGLRAEVAKEPSEYTPLDRRHPLLRSSDNSTLLVTSPSLPDRIRYMPYEERKKIFENYHGGLFLDDTCEAGAFGMSRLAMETVGFMDENFYPAYYEDTDWRYRLAALGFLDFFPKGVPNKRHFENVIHRLASSYDSRPKNATEAEIFAKGTFHIIHSVHNEHTIIKKIGADFRRKPGPHSQCLALPIDAWVMDVPRRKILMEAFAASHKFYKQGGPAGDPSMGILLLSWLPQEERRRILGGFPGAQLKEVVMRAVHNCILVRHSEQ